MTSVLHREHINAKIPIIFFASPSFSSSSHSAFQVKLYEHLETDCFIRGLEQYWGIPIAETLVGCLFTDSVGSVKWYQQLNSAWKCSGWLGWHLVQYASRMHHMTEILPGLVLLRLQLWRIILGLHDIMEAVMNLSLYGFGEQISTNKNIHVLFITCMSRTMTLSWDGTVSISKGKSKLGEHARGNMMWQQSKVIILHHFWSVLSVATYCTIRSP